MRSILCTLLLAGLFGGSLAHPGQSHHEIIAEAKKRAEFLSGLERKDSSHCHSMMEANGQAQKIARRRADMIDTLRRERSVDPVIQERDVWSLLNKSHKSTAKLTMDTPTDQVFGPNKSCVLSPEIYEGPFYVTGELVRQNLTEGHAGVPLHLDILVLDHTTCQPVTDQFVEIWTANATGVYGNIASSMNGAGSADMANLNNTMLRGFQQTDKNGVVAFNTLMPGHYPGRTHHVHVVTHQGATKLPNNTIRWGDGALTHIGQFYFDQDLLNAVETVAPYSTNKQAWTKNNQDFLIAYGAANNDDPLINYVLLGDTVDKGVFGFITIGVDTTAKRTISQATWWGESGGIRNPTGPTGFGKREGEEEHAE